MKTRSTYLKRLSAVTAVAALALTVATAGAQAHSVTRYFEDRAVDGGGGNLRLDVVFKNKRPKGPYTPRILKLFYVEIVPIMCNPGGDRVIASVQPTSIKFQKGKFVFPLPGDNIDAVAKGTSVKKGKKMDGTFEVFDFDPSPTVQNCTTDGPRVFHAGECRKFNQEKKLPVCRY